MPDPIVLLDLTGERRPSSAGLAVLSVMDLMYKLGYASAGETATPRRERANLLATIFSHEGTATSAAERLANKENTAYTVVKLGNTEYRLTKTKDLSAKLLGQLKEDGQFVVTVDPKHF